MEVKCNGKGVCRKVQQCIIRCDNVITHEESASLSPIGSCGAKTWSTCGYTCCQTEVDSVIMNDGKFHDEKSLEVMRPCHVQAGTGCSGCSSYQA